MAHIQPAVCSLHAKMNDRVSFLLLSLSLEFHHNDSSCKMPKTIWIMPTNTAYTWWRHEMETFSALLALCAGNSPVPVKSPHKGQWRGALMFSLMCVWINDWVNNREAGDLRRHRGHYDVNVMSLFHTRREYNNALKTMSTSWESVWEGTKTLDHNKIHRGHHIIFYLRNVITGVGWKYVIDKTHYFIFPRVGLFEHKAYHQQRRVEIRQRLKTS